MNTLNEQYEEKVRPCIDLIDSLHSLGIEKDLALPAIAVIGDQSSGKSSVLEALSGVALPRGSGIQTRCPLELKMKRKKEGEDWFGSISYKNHMEEISNPGHVEKKIREAQNKMAGFGAGISSDLIRLEIASPDVPDLTLIDLPGITRVAVEGQPENIYEQIKRVIKKFITRQETISLIVIPCNMDIATTEALKMAQQVDPEGERTMGILTKPDLVDKGTEETVVKTVRNEVIPLMKGYMIVKCRGQREIIENVSLAEAIETENDFFENHAHFKTLYDEGQATVPRLAEKLTMELVHHIQKSLPRLEEQIEEKLAQTQAELDKHGNGPPTVSADRLTFLIDKVTAFTQDAIYLTKGEELKCGVKSSIFFILRNVFSEWKETIETSGKTLNDTIESPQYEQKYRGRELPGFTSYRIFETMIKEQIERMEEPAVLKLKQVTEIIRKELFELARSSLAGFPNLIKTAKMKIEAIVSERESAAESMLRTQFKMEMVVYTQDSTYDKMIGKRKRDDEQDGFFATTFMTKRTVNKNNNRDTMEEYKERVKSYYHIVSQRMADQIPLVIRYEMLQEVALQLQRQMLQIIQDDGKNGSLLQEDCGIKNRRIYLQNRLKRLSNARSLLTEFSMNIYNFSTS
ncbi:interferon-induced GTP-binding protein Mx-like isoform X2 [Mugil cephalus]|nr:interferon-induced GTP-binding protein Mx-like isoform X2 [Mugil cephalus]